MEDPANALAYGAVQGSLDQARDAAPLPEVREMRSEALAALPRRSPTRPLLAACLLIGGLLSIFMISTNYPGIGRPGSIHDTPNDTQLIPERYMTPVGARRDVVLADGSIMTLNTGSVAEVRYTDAERDVRLLNGQAIFRVAKNHARPFIVTAGDRRITATGTAFDVRLDGGEVKVVLIEGHVNVAPVAPAGLERLIPSLAVQKMEAGEELVAVPGEAIRVSAVDVDQSTSWRRGQLVFRDERLAAVVAEVNRYSDTKIVIEDPRVANLKISGVFGVKRLENLQAALLAQYPLEAKVRSPRVIELRYRDAAS